MGDLLGYLLPREHTSLLRSMVICFVAGILGITIQAAATLIPNVVPGAAGEWLELIVLVAGSLLYWVPIMSGAIAAVRRADLFPGTGEMMLNVMLLRDYLRGLWPSRTSGKE